MEEPWEALDLDDSDISSSSSFSLLRRCSLQSPQPPPHSLPSQSLHNYLSPPPPRPQPLQQPQPVSRSPIPGPAGAIQAAMHRENRLTSRRNVEAPEISTQEYIRRVEEDDCHEFSRSPWVFALDILRRDGDADATPLRTVKQNGGAERIDKVVAVIKSCKPNGLGDIMVTLKDPTDTVDASVHRKVMSTGECGKLVAVGSVMILRKVVAFYSSCASCYLNVTRSNVVKVISVDCAVQSFSEANSHPCSDLEIPRKTTGLTDRRPEAHFEDVQLGCYISKGKTAAEELMGKENSRQATSLVSNRQIGNAGNKIPKGPIRIDPVDSGVKALGFNKFRDNSPRRIQPCLGIPEGLARNHEDLDNADNRRLLGDFRFAPNVPENLDSQCACQANGAKIQSLQRGNNFTSMADKLDVQVDSHAAMSSSISENLDDLDISMANDVRKQRHRRDIISPPYMVKNLDDQEIHKPNDPQKRRQPKPTEIVSNTTVNLEQDQEATVAKKQRLVLISQTSVQEWTDEQLGILDMDEE